MCKLSSTMGEFSCSVCMSLRLCVCVELEC